MTGHETVLVLDVETRPDPAVTNNPQWWERLDAKIEAPSNYKDEMKKAAYVGERQQQLRDKIALSSRCAMLACVGLMLQDDDTPTVLANDELTRDGEKHMLRQLAEVWPESPGCIVGFNVRDFDVPLLAVRLAIHGLELPWLPMPRNYRQVVELRDLFNDGPLSEWRFVFGGGFKDVEGKQLLELPISELVEHCRDDVRVEAMLAARTAWIWNTSTWRDRT